MHTRPSTHTLITIGFTLLGVLLFVYTFRIIDVLPLVTLLQRISLPALLGALGTLFLHFLMVIAALGVLYRALGVTLPYRSLFRFQIIKYAIGYLTPFLNIGGEPVMAYLLSVHHNIPIRVGLAPLITERLLRIIISGILVGGLLIFSLSSTALSATTTFLTLGGFGILVTVLLVMTVHRRIRLVSRIVSALARMRVPGMSRLVSSVTDLENNMRALLFNNGITLAKTSLFIVIATFFSLGTIAFLLAALRIPFNLDLILALYFLTAIVAAIPIPGALGVLEGTSIATLALFQFSPETGIALALLVRAVNVPAVTLGLILLFPMRKEVRARSQASIRQNR